MAFISKALIGIHELLGSCPSGAQRNRSRSQMVIFMAEDTLFVHVRYRMQLTEYTHLQLPRSRRNMLSTLAYPWA